MADTFEDEFTTEEVDDDDEFLEGDFDDTWPTEKFYNLRVSDVTKRRTNPNDKYPNGQDWIIVEFEILDESIDPGQRKFRQNFFLGSSFGKNQFNQFYQFVTGQPALGAGAKISLKKLRGDGSTVVRAFVEQDKQEVDGPTEGSKIHVVNGLRVRNMRPSTWQRPDWTDYSDSELPAEEPF